MAYWIRGLNTSETKGPLRPADGRQDMAAILTSWGRRKLPFIGGIDFRLAHQLPGKPAAGAGGKHVGSY